MRLKAATGPAKAQVKPGESDILFGFSRVANGQPPLRKQVYFLLKQFGLCLPVHISQIVDKICQIKHIERDRALPTLPVAQFLPLQRPMPPESVFISCAGPQCEDINCSCSICECSSGIFSGGATPGAGHVHPGGACG